MICPAVGIVCFFMFVIDFLLTAVRVYNLFVCFFIFVITLFLLTVRFIKREGVMLAKLESWPKAGNSASTK